MGENIYQVKRQECTSKIATSSCVKARDVLNIFEYHESKYYHLNNTCILNN